MSVFSEDKSSLVDYLELSIMNGLLLHNQIHYHDFHLPLYSYQMLNLLFNSVKFSFCKIQKLMACHSVQIH